jgi:AsmA protein
MPKILKISLYSLSAAALLFMLALVAILLLVDPNDFKDDITNATRDATGRELTLEGDIKLSVFPWLGLSLGRVQLGNAPNFGDQPFASVEAVDIQVKLLPLLKSKLEMKTVRLHGLFLNLARKADGSTNWDDLTGAAAEAAPPTESTSKPATEESAPPPLAALAIGGVELRDARVVWDDQQAEQRIVLDNFNLETGVLAPPEPVDIKLSLDLETTAPALRNHIAFSTRIDMDETLQHFTLSDLTLALESRGDSLPVSPLTLRLGAEVEADLGQQQISVSELQIDSLGTQLRGTINLRQWQNGNARLTIDVTDPQPLAALLPPDLSNQLLDKASLTTEADWNLDQQTASVKSFQLSVAGIQLEISANASRIIDAPKAQGQLTVTEFSPRQLAQTAAITLPETHDPSVLNKASLALDFSGSPDELTVKNLQLAADDTTLSGTARVKNFAQPAISFDLNVNTIDVDRYLPPTSDTPPPAPAGAAVGAAQLPLEPLRALDVDGRISVAKFKAANARLADILLVFKAKDGQLRLHPLQANLYDGSYTGNIGMDVRSETPKLSLDETISNVQAGLLLKDLLDDDPISGSANVRATITAQGIEPDAMMKTLNGTFSMSFLNGAVKGINIGQMLREANAKLKNQPAPPKIDEKTDFAELSASANISKGVISNQDLTAKSPLLRVAGKGTVNLPQESLNYRLKATLVGTSKGQGGKELSKLKGLPIPIKIKGRFDAPKITLDYKSLMSAKAKQDLEKKKQKLKKKTKEQREKAKDKVKEKAGKALEKLFR